MENTNKKTKVNNQLRNVTGNLNQLARRDKAGIEDLRGKADGLWEKADGILPQLARL